MPRYEQRFAANYSTICDEWMPVFGDKLFGLESILIRIESIGLLEADLCGSFISFMDFNGDQYINFREFTGVLKLIARGGDSNIGTALSANCSSCVGVDVYNIHVSA